MRTPLPSGLPDLLPPVAEAEFRCIHQLLKRFMAHGYAPVIPPLAESEASLTAGQPTALTKQLFRVMDPLSRDMLAIRADMTTQIARIAAGGLAKAPRPLRLCYAGYTLRTAPDSLRTRRQHTQIGLELFGATAPSHEAEILAVAIDALAALNLTELSLDLSAPALLSPLLAALAEAQRDTAREAVARKDSAALRSLGASLIADLLDASGPAQEALARLRTLAAKHPAIAQALSEIESIMALLKSQGVEPDITIDLLEISGLGEYTGIASALYLRHPALQIGRGGHYTNRDGEAASGFTFYIDDVLEALGSPPAPRRLAVPAGTPLSTLRHWQEEGFSTVRLHGPMTEDTAYAAGCTHLLASNGQAAALANKQ